MIYIKVSAMLLSLFGFGIWAWWHVEGNERPQGVEVKTHIPDVSPEVREKAFGLLNRVMDEASRLKSKEDGIKIRFLLTDLLWEKDEPKARKLFAELVKEADAENCACSVISTGTMAARDAKMTMDILKTSKSGFSSLDYDEIYGYFVRQYPHEAFDEARQAINANNYVSYIGRDVGILGNTNTFKPSGEKSKLETLYEANKDYGAQIAGEIVRKLGDRMLDVPSNVSAAKMNGYYSSNMPPLPDSLSVNAFKPSVNLPLPALQNTARNITNSNISLPRANPNVIPIESAIYLLRFGVDTNANATKKGERSILTEAEMSSLAKIITNNLIRARTFSIYKIKAVFPYLEKYAPVETSRLEKLLTKQQIIDLNRPEMEWPRGDQDRDQYSQIPAPANETPSEKAEREFVNDVRYYSRVTNDCNREQDAEKFAMLPNPQKYPDLMEYYRNDLAMAFAKAGKLKEFREYLSGEKNRTKRLTLLSYAAYALANGSNQTVAAKLVEEAKDLLPLPTKRRNEFLAVEAFILALSKTDPPSAFVLAEKQLDAANRLLEISNELKEFKDEQGLGSELEAMRRQLASNSENIIKIIRIFANLDFDRTVKLADRFRSPEQQVFFRWYIANSLLNKDSEGEEKNTRELRDEDYCG